MQMPGCTGTAGVVASHASLKALSQSSPPSCPVASPGSAETHDSVGGGSGQRKSDSSDPGAISLVVGWRRGNHKA